MKRWIGGLVALAALSVAPAQGKGQSSVTIDNLTPTFASTIVITAVTNETDLPRLKLRCYQNGVLVGAGDSTLHVQPWTWRVTLQTSTWTSGPADCTVTLYSATNRGKITDLATLRFGVL